MFAKDPKNEPTPNSNEVDRLCSRLGLTELHSLPDCGYVDESILRTFLKAPDTLSQSDQLFVVRSLRDYTEWRHAAVRIIVDDA